MGLVIIFITGCKKDPDSPISPAPPANILPPRAQSLPFKVAYVNKDSLWVVGPDTLPERKICLVGSVYPIMSWSPDGRYLTFRSEDDHLIILNNDYSVRNKIPILYQTPGGFDNYSWSHSGRYLIYGRYSDGIFLYDAEVNTYKKIFQSNGLTYDHNAVFSPDDSLIAFFHNEYGSYAWLKVMRPDGSQVRTISDSIFSNHDENINMQWLGPHKIIFKLAPWIQNKPKGIFIATLNANKTKATISQVIADNDTYTLLISPNQAYYAFYNNTSHVWKFGLIDYWNSAALTNYGSIKNLTWTPQSTGLIFTTDSLLRWRLLDGTDYYINKTSSRWLSTAL